MRYPTVSIEHVHRVQRTMSRGDSVDVESGVRWIGDERTDMDLDPIHDLVARIRSDWEQIEEDKSIRVLDDFEAHVGVLLHGTFDQMELPAEQLDDPGFWRYLTVAHLWWFVQWRERSAMASNDWSRIKVYVDGTRHSECVLLRAYIRARIAFEGGSYELASAVPSATDLWRSHILRVRTSYQPDLTAALIRSQVEDRMTTDRLREFARKLNRLNSNVITAGYESEDARSLIEELRS